MGPGRSHHCPGHCQSPSEWRETTCQKKQREKEALQRAIRTLKSIPSTPRFERLDFELAAGVDGIDDEIALLRVEIKSILELEHNPEDVKLIIQATNALERLIRTRYKITKEQRKGLKEAIGNVIRDIAVPLGIAAIQK